MGYREQFPDLGRSYVLYGVKAADFSGAYAAWINGIHPDDLPMALEDSRLALANEKNYDSEFRVVLPDGKIRVLKAHAVVQRNPQGQALKMIGINYDITDRKQAEQALQESQRFIQQIADASPNILYLYDLQEHRNVYVNREIGTILGYTPEEIQVMGANLLQNLIHPDDFTRLPEQYAKLYAAQEGEILEFEYRMRHANGEWRWLYSRDSIFSRDATGCARQIIGTAQDVTERKQLEQAQHRLIALLEASTDYILIADLSGTAIWNNTALKTLRSLESDEVVARQRPIDYHPQWVVDVIEQQAVPTAMAQGSWLGETVLLDATGQEIPVSQLLLAHRSPQGAVEFFSTIMRDIRIYKDYEQRLERSNAELLRATRLKDEFLANMSHELRTPLNAILGMSEGLQEEAFGSLNDRQKKAIATIERSGQHLLGLINDILELSKIEAGKLELNITSVSIAQLCKASLDFVQQQAFKKQIQLQAILPSTLGAMTMDERRIRQVLINLLTNAVKFTPSGGKITLEAYLEPAEVNLSEHIPLFRSPTTQLFQDSPSEACHQANSYCLCLVVTDTGIGIAAADQAKLFQPFIQIDSSLNRQYEGTGLGLTLVKRIVELHGGEVSLQSELGQGSCFTVRLPYVCEMANPIVPYPPLRSPSPETIAAPSPLQSIQSQPPLILLAEDNLANVSTFSDYLSAKGYCIVVAKNGQEAIACAQTHQPNLILMDVQMPEVDGLEAIRQIRLNPALAKIPIIALTALAMAGDRERCLQAGADDYLSKPVKLKDLVIAIQRLLNPH
jgi:PAS domain S-box-containing protein